MVLLFGRPWVVYSSPSPLHLHYFDNTTAPLLILQDKNDPCRRPSPCGEGSVRYMRAFTKAAIVAAAAVLALVSVAKAVATEALLESTVAVGTDPTGAGERGEAPELQVAALGGEKTGARNSGARGVPVAEPARAGRQFGLPRLKFVKDILASSSSRRWAGDSRGTPTVHDAASCFTGLVLGVPACASAARVDSGLFCRNAMSRASRNRVVLSLLSYREATKRSIGQGQ